MALMSSQRAYLRATTRCGVTAMFGIVLPACAGDRFHDVDFAEKPPMRFLNGGLFIGSTNSQLSGVVASASHQLQPRSAHLKLGQALRIADAKLESSPYRGFSASSFSYGCDDTVGCAWTFIYTDAPHICGVQVCQSSITVPVVVNDRNKTACVCVPPPPPIVP